MMYGRKQLTGVVVGTVLLVSLAVGNALAQEPSSAELELTPSRDSGVSGVAVLTDVEGGVRVQLSMRGLPEAGVEHINHIHGGGTCADDRAGRTAPVTIPLKPVVANDDGSGSATTTIEDVALTELFAEDEERFILLHAKTEEGQGVPPGISCADFVPRSGSGGFEALPASGGMRPMVLLSIVAFLGLGTMASLLVFRRGLT